MPGKPTIPRRCVQCEGDFYTWPYIIRSGGGKYCKPSCRYTSQQRALSALIAERIGPPEPNGCRLWIGHRDPKGYGVLKNKGKMLRAARLVLGITEGKPLLPTEMACHHCDNPPCVEETHLFRGVAADNSADMAIKGRAAQGDRHGLRIHPERVARGERAAGAKLTPHDVTVIRTRYAAGGITYRALAAEYPVSGWYHIRNIVKRRIWKHVP